ncbi:hypothetical protein PROFUN_15450 [Planoprotostelium fungivorum]|uniref:Uncharacterized protein n=1 Tax=Planoprotostelium fungivorum TaxID=1890364 RepID=A0A2P6MWA3_9EUKA|nr:hypothetical protein PROFUN_15450 [Planoprotostelium fungivorum]
MVSVKTNLLIFASRSKAEVVKYLNQMENRSFPARTGQWKERQETSNRKDTFNHVYQRLMRDWWESTSIKESHSPQCRWHLVGFLEFSPHSSDCPQSGGLALIKPLEPSTDDHSSPGNDEDVSPDDHAANKIKTTLTHERSFASSTSSTWTKRAAYQIVHCTILPGAHRQYAGVDVTSIKKGRRLGTTVKCGSYSHPITDRSNLYHIANATNGYQNNSRIVISTTRIFGTATITQMWGPTLSDAPTFSATREHLLLRQYFILLAATYREKEEKELIARHFTSALRGLRKIQKDPTVVHHTTSTQ